MCIYVRTHVVCVHVSVFVCITGVCRLLKKVTACVCVGFV